MLNIPKPMFNEYKLDNGLHVVLKETPALTVSGRLTVYHGTLNESEDEAGYAHFLEHCLMVGGTGRYDPEEAEKERERFAYFNAVTNMDRTRFVVDMLAEETGRYIDFMAELLGSPRLDATRLNEEKLRVIREISDQKGHPSFVDTRDMQNALFGEEHPMCRYGLGSTSNVSQATQDRMRMFHHRGYNAKNMVLILAGGLPNNTHTLIEKNLGQLPPGERTRIYPPSPRPLAGRTELYRAAPELYNKDEPQESSAELFLDFLVPPETSQDYASLGILAHILGGDLNSRLFRKLGQRKGLVYTMRAGYNGALNSGVLWVHGKIPSTLQQEAIDCVFQELGNARNSISQEELERAKRMDLFYLTKGLESNSGHISIAEYKIETGRDIERSIMDLQAITLERLQETAQKYLPEDRASGKYVMLVRDPLL